MSVKTTELQKITDAKKVNHFVVESNEHGTGLYSGEDWLNKPIKCGQLRYGLGWTPETTPTEPETTTTESEV